MSSKRVRAAHWIFKTGLPHSFRTPVLFMAVGVALLIIGLLGL